MAVECAAAHLNVGSVNRLRHDLMAFFVIDLAVFDRSFFQCILILIEELLQAVVFIIGDRIHPACGTVFLIGFGFILCFSFIAADVKYICTGIRFEIAVIDIDSAAVHFSVVPGPC